MQGSNRENIKLSIIIPYYDCYKYFIKLLEVLIPQITEEVEVLIIDDGCHETRINEYVYQEKYKDKWDNISIYHLLVNSGGASYPRNIGLDLAVGEYIAFIDADDLITEEYISKILNKIKKNPDIIYLSWESKVHHIIMNTKPPRWNCAVWCRVYKRELIGSTRFNTDLIIAEDWEFNNHIKPETNLSIKQVVYIYNNGRPGSLVNKGESI